jgi:predicted nucleic acid-binding protein
VNAHWLDASVILRLLTGDPPTLARQAMEIFQRAASGELVLKLHPVTVGEVVYTLKSFYRSDPEVISNQLLALMAQEGVEVHERRAVARALSTMVLHNVSYADALLASLAGQDEGVATFDRGQLLP